MKKIVLTGALICALSATSGNLCTEVRAYSEDIVQMSEAVLSEESESTEEKSADNIEVKSTDNTEEKSTDNTEEKSTDNTEEKSTDNTVGSQNLEESENTETGGNVEVVDIKKEAEENDLSKVFTTVQVQYADGADSRVTIGSETGNINIQVDKNTDFADVQNSLVFLIKTSQDAVTVSAADTVWLPVVDGVNKQYNAKSEGSYKYEVRLPQKEGYTYADGVDMVSVQIDVVMGELTAPSYAGWQNATAVAEWKDDNLYKEAYQLKLYKDGGLVETIDLKDVKATTYDFSSYINENGKGIYTFGVKTFYNGVYKESVEKKSSGITACQISFQKNSTATVKNMPSQMIILSGNKITKPAASPACKGYTFVGWYSDKAGKTAFSFSKKIKANTVVYAKWKKVSVGKPASLTLLNKSQKKTKYTVKVSWKKVSGAEGYQISYSYKNASGKKVSKTLNVAKGSKTSANIKIKYSNIYTVRVRAYKKDSLSKKVYGAYSAKKTIAYPEVPVCRLDNTDSDLKYYNGKRVRLYFSNMEEIKPDGVKIVYGDNQVKTFEYSKLPMFSVTLQYVNSGSHTIEVYYYRNIKGKQVFSQKTLMTYKN